MATVEKKCSDKLCGKGGWKCRCCKPGRRDRTRHRRQVKRGKVKEHVRSEIESQDPHRRILVDGKWVVDPYNDPPPFDQEDD